MIKNSRKASGLWILLFLLVQSVYSFAYEPTLDQKNKEAVTKAVYKDIVRSIGDGRQAPVLIFAFNKTALENYTTYYSPKRQTIIIGEGIYNITVSFGADSLDALAFVLGHELSHYYKDHGWGMSFGAAPENFKIAQEIYDSELTIDRKKIMEAEADYFGCLYGYLAGYNTLNVGGKFISAF
ncbi:MAG: M48 family metalloprotease [Flavobacteriales bacterium]|nr:M48 family metalloprotease [Flavobacteriales bacterium]